ncbi:DUF3883 domain-containing protein [Catellatospora aurea]|uniref:DUF3883 domain-containing protein n=1 Tax=Catellatospora aurea TaxID=1337874 RepID=A0ABW2GLA9_9ACTN
MTVPPEPVLRAAVRWLERLPASGPVRCRALFTTHAEFSDITPTQYDTALGWLRTTGLLDGRASSPPAVQVFTAAMHGGVPWLRDADALIHSPDELPSDSLDAAAALGLSPDEAFALVNAAWGKVDTAERKRVGDAGEKALLVELQALPNASVDHVARWSDAFGYDIAVHAPGITAHLEVKATTRRGRLTAYISRNEYRTMQRDPAWRMVAVLLTPDLELASVSTVPSDWIADQVPSDSSSFGRWESCRLDIPAAVLEAGIPLIKPLIATSGSMLQGVPG